MLPYPRSTIFPTSAKWSGPNGTDLRSSVVTPADGSGSSAGVPTLLDQRFQSSRYALCDVTRTTLESARAQLGGAKTTTDWREIVSDPSIDAVVISTADHHHAPAAIAAMREGKHVYSEKPLAHNVWEAREVAKAAKETGVATQMGNQGHATEGVRETVEWIADGAIGAVREVHAWVPASRWNK